MCKTINALHRKNIVLMPILCNIVINNNYSNRLNIIIIIFSDSITTARV